MSNQKRQEYSIEDYPLGVNEIGEVLGVKPATVSQWQQRNVLPLPDASINKGRTKLWKTKTVIDWANATGRNNNSQNYEQTKEQAETSNKKWRARLTGDKARQWEAWGEFNIPNDGTWVFGIDREEE